jgi:DNA damage-binding protein 1
MKIYRLDTIPRSVMITYLESKPFIFVGLGNTICIYIISGDGNVISYHWSDQTLQEQRIVTLGTQPILLKRFKSKKNDYIFSASDRPTVIYSHHQKLLYSNVNIEVSMIMES